MESLITKIEKKINILNEKLREPDKINIVKLQKLENILAIFSDQTTKNFKEIIV